MGTPAKRKKKYECLGGPLCGKMEAPVKVEVGVPCFAYDDADGRSHYYRLAKSGDYRYWHYLGTKGLDKTIRPFMRPTPNDA